MIAYKKLRPAASSIRPFLRRWHRQHSWRMEHRNTRRMQMNTHRWYCVLKRTQRETLLAWARSERSGYAACVEARNRLPSNDDLPRSFVSWHMANVYARVGLGEDKETVLKEEESALLIKIRAYNTSQEQFTHTWHGCAGHYGEDEARTKMQHARTMMRTV